MTKYKNSKIQTQQNTKEQNRNCQNTNVTKFKQNGTLMQKVPKYKHGKIQKTKYILPKCKWNKIQMAQNTNMKKYK